MPGGMFFGGLGSGLSQGIQLGQRLKLQADEHKLKAKMLEHTIKKNEQDLADADELRKQQTAYADLVEKGNPTIIGGPVQGPHTEAGEPPAPPPERTPATPQQIRAAEIRSSRPGHIPTQRQSATGEMTEYQKVNLELQKRRLDQREEGGQGVPSQIWFRIKKENPGAPLEVLTDLYNGEVAKQKYTGGAANKAGGVAGEAAQTLGEPIQPMQPFTPATTPTRAPAPTTAPVATPTAPAQPTGNPPTPGASPALRSTAAKEKVKQDAKPIPEGTAKDLTGLDTLLNKTIGDIESYYDEGAHLGSIKGDDYAYSFRRRFGGTINQPVGDREAQFRSALSDAADQLLRARSGAQINEQEYARLVNMLPKATDEPAVFKANLKRFKEQVAMTLENRKKYGTTTRGELSQQGSSIPPPPTGYRRAQ